MAQCKERWDAAGGGAKAASKLMTLETGMLPLWPESEDHNDVCERCDQPGRWLAGKGGWEYGWAGLYSMPRPRPWSRVAKRNPLQSLPLARSKLFALSLPPVLPRQVV